jgi:hypothetical protein
MPNEPIAFMRSRDIAGFKSGERNEALVSRTRPFEDWAPLFTERDTTALLSTKERVTELALGLVEAVRLDEASGEDGFDLSAGLIGRHVSAWIRRIAIERPAQIPSNRAVAVCNAAFERACKSDPKAAKALRSAMLAILEAGLSAMHVEELGAQNPDCPGDGTLCAPSGDGKCVACDDNKGALRSAEQLYCITDGSPTCK